jgi:protein-disulfide isomerase
MNLKTPAYCLLVVGLWHLASPAFAQKLPVTAAKTETPGITREQADAILAELRQIRQLLEKQVVPTSPEKVQIRVASGWHVMGRDDAPVTILEFTDLQCPFCRRFHSETFPLIKKNYIDTGKVRYVSRDLPLTEVHLFALKAAEAARCAGDQGRFWEFRSAMLELPEMNEDAILSSAKALALDVPSIHLCLNSEKYRVAVQTDATEAAALQIGGTPTFLVAHSSKDTLDGVRMEGAQPYPAFERKIDELLKEQ